MFEVGGIVLAGGRSSRMGTDKAQLAVAGRTLLQRAIDGLAAITDHVWVVTDGRAPYPVELPAGRIDFVADQVPGAGALGGIYSGLAASDRAFNLAVACDMPFLHPALLRYLVSLAPGYDLVLPVIEGGQEPLHAVYGRGCLAPMAERIQRGQYKVIGFVDSVRVRLVDETEAARHDPTLRSFRNCNTPEDLAEARRLIGAASPAER